MSTGKLSDFYSSPAWKKFSESIRRQRHYVCEKCGQPGNVVHHRIPLTERNVNDPTISLNPGNMQLLCRECHERHHNRAAKQPKRTVLFDEQGNVVGISEK